MPRTKTRRVARTLDARDWALVIECLAIVAELPTATPEDIDNLTRLIDVLRVD